MKIFSIIDNGKLVSFKEIDFEETNREAYLEDLLKNNPEYFFEKGNILILGSQVSTNLNKFIDLLGIDKNGNSVAIELKRGKTPRDTIAQLLEYASFVENLDYYQLNEIFQSYSGEENTLENYHQQYFQGGTDEKVSFNKSTKLVIVAQEISKEIRQTAIFLRKKGIDIFCMEFKYFENKDGEKIISSDFVVGDEEFIRQKIQSSALPRINEKQFMDSLDKNGSKVFRKIMEFARQKGLLLRWGTKGFSLNVEFDSGFVCLFFGYPPQSVYKQSIYTGFEEIRRKINDADVINEFYKEKLEKTGCFIKAGNTLKWQINRPYSEAEVEKFLDITEKVIVKIEERGMNI